MNLAHQSGVRMGETEVMNETNDFWENWSQDQRIKKTEGIGD